MELDYFLITFIVLVAMTTIYFPISGYYEARQLRQSIAKGDTGKKINFYRSTIIWAWVPIVIILLLIPISGLEVSSIGLKWINIDTTSISRWIVYPTIGIYFIYLIYNIYSIILFKRSKTSRAKVAKSIPNHTKLLLPVTQKEKSLWNLVSISAGITEELLYRGYFFYALARVFPGLSSIHILIISTIIFGMAHIYLGKEAIRSGLLGLFFGIFYIVFDSIIPVIILHVSQDLVVCNILDEETIGTIGADSPGDHHKI